MDIVMKPSLENMKKYFKKFDWDIAYPIQCLEKYFCEGDLFYLKKKDMTAIIVKDNSILIASKQETTVNEEEKITYGIDKLYFKDIKKINLKEFGTLETVLGGHLQLTITINGYEDIILNSKDDSFKGVNGQEVLDIDLKEVIIKIFEKIK